MKKMILMAVGIYCFTALNAQSTPAEQMSSLVAQKMKDTLSLTDVQMDSIYNINMRLHNDKTLVRLQYSNPDSLRVYIQKVENRRDGLYGTILSEEKYLLYKQKKRALLSNQ